MTAPTGLNEPPSHPSAQILDSAAALARAELKLLWFHAQKLGVRIAVALGFTWLAMLLTQITVLILALSPIIIASYGGMILAASAAPSLLLALIAWTLCIKKWLSVSERPNAPEARAAPSLELSASELGRR
jgi:hypothetical protein